MVHLKSKEELELIRNSAILLGKTHGEVAKMVRPGIKTSELDQVAEAFIRDHGGKPSFKNYRGFPATLCISVNEVVVHGFPGKYELKEGDVIAVDCGVQLQGYHSDSAYTYPLPGTRQEVLDLLERTYIDLVGSTKPALVHCLLNGTGCLTNTAQINLQRSYTTH